MPGEGDERAERVTQVVRLDAVVRAAERHDVGVDGGEVHAAHVGAVLNHGRALALVDGPHAACTVVRSRDEFRGIELGPAGAPHALLVLVKHVADLPAVHVPQAEHALVVRGGHRVFYVRVPHHRRELRLRLHLRHRAVHRGAAVDQGLDLEDAQALGDTGGGDVLRVAVPARAADHLAEGVHVTEAHVGDGAKRRLASGLGEILAKGV